MKIDAGLAVVIGAVLIFYLRLIILQQQRVRRLASPAELPPKAKKGNTQSKASAAKKPPVSAARYSIISPRPRDRIIGAAGALLILLGVLLYAGVIPWMDAQPYWWIPTAIGIVAFSWLFRL